MKRLLLYLMFTLCFSWNLNAQITQDSTPALQNYSEFKSEVEKNARGLAAGLYSSIGVTVFGIAGLLVHGLLGETELVGSQTFKYAFMSIAVLGVLSMTGTGFAWLAIDQELKSLTEHTQVPPLIVFECHISSSIQYAPVEITCNGTSSTVQTYGTTLTNDSEWDFDDGLGYQKRGLVTNYTFAKAGKYKIKRKVDDSNNSTGVGTFK